MPSAAVGRHQDPSRDPALKRLLIRPGAIGDVIVSLPALEHLRAGYTEVWVPSPVVPLVRFADRVRPLASTGIDLVGITEPALDCFKHFGSIVSWYGSNREDFREAVAGLPFTSHPALPRGDVHAVDFYARQVGAPDGLVPRIDCPAAAVGDLIAVHTSSGSPAKNWPLENFHALGLPGAWFVEHHEDLYDLACRLAAARAYVGNDSGITHLAAAVGTPVVAIFRRGASDPRVWAPRGPRVTVLVDATVAEVRRAVLDSAR